MGRLPFKPAQGFPVGLGETMQSAAMRPGVETAPLGDCIAKAIAVLPFAESPVGAGNVAFPLLTPEQYASLRADLSVWPERMTEILPRYYVFNEAAHRALNEYWRQLFAGNAAARAWFDKAFAEYTDWLRTLRMARWPSINRQARAVHFRPYPPTERAS